jgi:hypothetical protein
VTSEPDFAFVIRPEKEAFDKVLCSLFMFASSADSFLLAAPVDRELELGELIR